MPSAAVAAYPCAAGRQPIAAKRRRPQPREVTASAGRGRPWCGFCCRKRDSNISAMSPGDASVLIVGAGPVGMVLALELARLRVPSLLVDTEAATRAYPKGNTHNARTMEYYRTLGVAGQVRAVGLPADHPTDVASFTRLNGHELARLPMPSTVGKLAAVREADDFAQVIEPVHRANQMYVEKVLSSACERSPLISVCRGWQAEEFTQHEGGVDLTVRPAGDGRREEDAGGADPTTGANGRPVTVRGAFLVGCDGGNSRIRKQLGIRYAGGGPLRTSPAQRIPTCFLISGAK